MAVDDRVEERALCAALSLFVGRALPPPLAAVAAAHGLQPGGWVFPDSPASLELAEFDDPRHLAERGHRLLADAARLGLAVLLPGDAGWPMGTACDDLPCLWVSSATGRSVDALLGQAVTVTGARACTSYGQHVATDVAYALATLGWTVVSALGYGIDDHAARSARAAGGPVVLVAASGLSPQDHPQTLRGSLAAAADSGAAVSPFPPGTPASRARWTVQQHLLATLSAATVVVEASRASRALDVARIAAEHDRAVCAVPGPITSAVSTGCHRLLEEGTVRLVTSGRDVTEAIAAHGSRHPQPHRDLYEVSGRMSWDDGTWHTRDVPPLLIRAPSPDDAAEAAFDIVFAARPDTSAVLHAGVRAPDGSYHTAEINTSR